MVSLIYTTTSNKRIKVYFDELDQVWIAYKDLGDLFNSTYEEIEEQRSNLLYEDSDNPICMEMSVVFTGEKYYSLFLIMIIGRVLNETEIESLTKWYNTMTEEHSIELSDEFNKNLTKAIKSKNQ